MLRNSQQQSDRVPHADAVARRWTVAILLVALSVLLVLVPLAARAQTPAAGPVVTRLQVAFAFPVSTYSVTANDPAGGTLTYEWRMAGELCGTPRVPWTQRGASVSWSHSDQPPDLCSHSGADHDVTVTVVVISSRGTATQCITHGSEPVNIANPPCQGVPVPTATPARPTATTGTGTATPRSPPAEGPGTFDRDVPNVGVNTATWNGGTVRQLSAATAAAGGISVTVFVDGKATVLIPGAPAFVNAAFNDAFADGTVPAGTIVLVVK